MPGWSLADQGGKRVYSFNEAELEQAVLEWFQELTYNVAYGPEISPGGDYPERDEYDEVILRERLMDALQRINPKMPSEVLDEAYRKVVITKSPSLIVNNKEFYRLITDGVDVEVKRPDGSVKTDKYGYLILTQTRWTTTTGL